MSACVILPVYNEASHLAALIKAIRAQSLPLLLVDDASIDESVRIAREMECEVLTTERNQGKGMAIYRGLAHVRQRAGWDVVVLMDSDGQHDPEEIRKFLEAHDAQGADVVVGNRMRRRQDMPAVRWWTNRITSYWVSKLAGREIPDSQCGFRSLKRSVVEKLDLVCRRFDLESEMLIQAGRMGFSVTSVAVRSIYEGGISRINPFADTMRFIRLILRYLVK